MRLAARAHRRGAADAGMSLVEVTIVLLAVTALAAMLAPAVNNYTDQSRQIRVRNDVKVIANAINDFISDTGEHQFLINGSNGTDSEPATRADGNRVNLLIGDGDTPTLVATLSTETFWTLGLNGTTVDTLSNHLIENLPQETPGNRYRNPSDITVFSSGGNNTDFAREESSGLNAPFSWRGAYLTGPVDPDPWGNRYAVNVAFLDPSPTAVIGGITATLADGSAVGVIDYPRMDVFVLSAGPDEEIDTKSAQDGVVPGDDDFIYVVSGNAK